MAECFSALLVASADKAVKFVAKYIDSDDEPTAEAAMLALGESRLPAAYLVLKEKWNRTVLMPVKRAVLAAMAALKLEEAIAFLISLVESANAETAAAAVEALCIYRHNERVSESVRTAVLTRKEKAIVEQYRESFGS
jgi:HEAT repeat protein